LLGLVAGPRYQSSQRRAEANAVGLDNREPSGKRTEKSRLHQEALQYAYDILRDGVVRQTQNNNAGILIRRIPPDISEVQIPSEKLGTTLTCTRGDLFVQGRGQSYVACKLYLVP
jgi:hypothetical protein